METAQKKHSISVDFDSTAPNYLILGDKVSSTWIRFDKITAVEILNMDISVICEGGVKFEFKCKDSADCYDSVSEIIKGIEAARQTFSQPS